MSKSNLIRLLELLDSDTEFKEFFCNNKNFDELYNMCRSKIEGYTKEELQNFLKILYKLSNSKKKLVNIEQELDNVSGGTSTWRAYSRNIDDLVGYLNRANCLATGLNLYYKLEGQDLGLEDVQQLINMLT